MKIRITFGLTLALLLAVGCTLAQGADTKSKKKVAAKMFGNTSVTIGSPNEFVSMLKTFSPSISWGKEYGNFHEIEMTSFNLAFAENNRRFDNSFQYTYNTRIGKGQKRVNYYLGAGVNSGYQFSRNNYSYSSIISSDNQFYKSRNVNLNLVVVPRITVDLGDRFMLDVNTAFNVYSYNMSSDKFNEYEPMRNQIGEAFPNQFTIKVGVAYKF